MTPGRGIFFALRELYDRAQIRMQSQSFRERNLEWDSLAQANMFEFSVVYGLTQKLHMYEVKREWILTTNLYR